MRCKSCKYDLSNLTEHRCPECGRAFDPRDAKSFESDQSIRKRDDARMFLIFMIPLILIAAFLGLSMLVYFVLWVFRGIISA